MEIFSVDRSDPEHEPLTDCKDEIVCVASSSEYLVVATKDKNNLHIIKARYHS